MAKLPEPIKNLPFQTAIKMLFDTEVIPYESGAPWAMDLTERLDQVLQELCNNLQVDPILNPRVNEVGNMLEPHVVQALQRTQIRAEAARKKSGGGQASAYPDIRFEFADRVIYLEVKTYAKGSVGSTFRAFYMSPSSDPKVHEDAIHLAVGFEMLDLGPTGDMTGSKAIHAYAPQAFKIVDLYGMPCDLKLEFNSSNKKMYDDGRIILQKRVDPKE